MTGDADVHLVVALFFLAVLAAALIGLWRTVGKDMPLILAALGASAPAPAQQRATLKTAAA